MHRELLCCSDSGISGRRRFGTSFVRLRSAIITPGVALQEADTLRTIEIAFIAAMLLMYRICRG